MNTGDTAWLLAATTLVLFMTVPGLAVYYGGLVRAKNVLSVAMQCFSVAAVVGVLWMIVGYSLAFGGDSFFGFIGNLEHAFLWDIKSDTLHGTIPEMLFVMFQMTFAIITPAVMVGCWVERTKYPAVIMISVLWSLLVYVPVCHWVWGDGGWLKELGAMDFAGGLVVHTSAGVAALVIVSQLGRRRGFPYELQPPHNPGLGRHRRRDAVGRLVRLQRRQFTGGRRPRRHGPGIHPLRCLQRLGHLGGAGLDKVPQALTLWHSYRGDCRPGRCHAGRRLCRPAGGPHTGSLRQRGVLLYSQHY